MNDQKVKLEIMLPQHVADELSYMIELINEAGSMAMDANSGYTVEDLAKYILCHIADGSRRPGAWERQMLEMLGLVANDPKHCVYRQSYGKPQSENDELVKVASMPLFDNLSQDQKD